MARNWITDNFVCCMLYVCQPFAMQCFSKVLFGQEIQECKKKFKQSQIMTKL